MGKDLSALETPRLLLRRMSADDLDALCAVLGDAEAMQYYPHPFSRQEVEQFIQKQILRYKNDGFGLWAVILKGTGELIGDCGLAMQEVEGQRQLEVGYHLRRDHWHRGYATEAARACVEYGFKELRVREIICMIRPENLPSRRVAERVALKAGKQVFWSGFNHLIYALECPPASTPKKK